MERPTTNTVTARATSLADHLAAARRRRKPAIAFALGVFALALGGALLWPATYRSTGTILIEQQEVPIDLVRSMVSSYADQRIQVISQRVMTSENLLRIIDRYNLYPDDRRSKPREALLGRMRDDITFSMISADVVDPRLGRPTKATIAFSVSYDSRSAALASKVANEIATLYLNENLESRKQLADDAASFMTAEAERLSKQIAELDSKLAVFKEQNVKRLPELNQLNLQLMSRAEEELRETDTRVRSLDQQIVYLEAQLAQLTPASQLYSETGERILSPADRLKVLKSDYARVAAIYAPDHPDILRMKREIAGLEREVGKVDPGNDLARQLREAQGQLAQMREKYSPDHPDVQQLERLIASIETTLRDTPPTAAAVRDQADNPAYIQVNSQREASLNERESLQRKRAALQAKINEIESRLSQSPEIEREYSAMVRDLDNAQLKYREVRQKQGEATLSKNLEAERKGERFTLIEPPLPAEEPVSPNRTAILLLGAVLAGTTGIGLIALLEALDTTVRGQQDLSALLPVAPLAILPWIETPAEHAARARFRRLSLTGAATGVVLAITLTHFLYRPLDVLWQVALRRVMG
jgi:polysaccharide biosynthesis transport protein